MIFISKDKLWIKKKNKRIEKKRKKGETQAKGIWKQDPEAKIWTQEGWEWGMDKASQWGTL